MVKRCSQKFDLHIQFLTILNAFGCASMCACNNKPLLKESGLKAIEYMVKIISCRGSSYINFLLTNSCLFLWVL